MSYFTDDLEAGTDYAFDVIAIGPDGGRSRPASILVGTPGGPGEPMSESVETPANLRSSVYSRSAAELFRDRSRTLPAPRYEVSRDGAVIGTTNGTSFFDDTLASGTRYAYTVVTIDRDGRRSAGSTLMLTSQGGTSPPPPSTTPFATPDPLGTTTLARLGYPGARDLASDLVSAAYLERYVEVDAAVLDLFPGDATDASVERVASCPGGGSVRGTGTNFPVTTLAFEGCVIAGRTLSGRVERVSRRFPTGAGSVTELTLTFDALRVEAGDAGTLTVTGSLASALARGQDERCNGFESTTDEIRIAVAQLGRAGDATRVTDADYTRNGRFQTFGDPGDAVTPCFTQREFAVDGTASVASTRFGTQAATIAIRGDVASDSGGGRDVRMTPVLEANFGDGSTLAITATSYPDRDVQVDAASDGTAVSFTDDYLFAPRTYATLLF